MNTKECDGMKTLPELRIDGLEYMTAKETQRFWKRVEWVLAHDNGEAARSHLAAGNPIYCADENFPNGLVRQWPDGMRELVSIGRTGTITVIQTL
ncbi:hypothetical protein [Ralstonia pseudosolanacearum]|uniref:hypothetical protein n=1 Tax=Ralstonia pseudosolanacearum TaxID=1310165 RepID=UPI00339966C0